MKKRKTITICSSVSFYKQVINIERELKTLGFTVKIPSIARKMQKTNDFDVVKQKSWSTNPSDYSKKTKLMLRHFKRVIDSDAILVVNFEKNGISGY